MRIVYLLLVGVGVGLVVAAATLAPPPPTDQAKVLVEALKRGPAERSAADIERIVQASAPPTSSASVRHDDEHFRDQRLRGLTAAMNGFGAGFLVIGIIGLLLSLLDTWQRSIRDRQSTPTTT